MYLFLRAKFLKKLEFFMEMFLNIKLQQYYYLQRRHMGPEIVICVLISWAYKFLVGPIIYVLLIYGP